MAKASSPLLLSSLFSLNDRSLLLFCALGMMLLPVDGLAPVFLFGDSTFDVGTNDFIPSRATANYLYYGIDFPHYHPTGRFSNGYNTADEIVKQLGYKLSPPPFLALVRDNSTFQAKILQGVNFASGGCGILNQTGFEPWGDVIPMATQVQQFATVQSNITSLLGQNRSAQFFNSSLFFISVGSNDIFEHHAFNETTVSKAELMDEIQSNFTVQLTDLYNLGARKFGIVSVPPIGCCPFARVQNTTGGCLTELNDYAQCFHSMVSSLLQNLSSQLQGMIYSFADSFSMTLTLINNPGLGGIQNISAACCGSGTLNAVHPCNKTANSNLCQHRDQFLFWDRFHPTQNVSQIAATFLFAGGPYVEPISFGQLADSSA